MLDDSLVSDKKLEDTSSKTLPLMLGVLFSSDSSSSSDSDSSSDSSSDDEFGSSTGNTRLDKVVLNVGEKEVTANHNTFIALLSES